MKHATTTAVAATEQRQRTLLPWMWTRKRVVGDFDPNRRGHRGREGPGQRPITRDGERILDLRRT